MHKRVSIPWQDTVANGWADHAIRTNAIAALHKARLSNPAASTAGVRTTYNAADYVLGLWPPTTGTSLQLIRSHVRFGDAWRTALGIPLTED